MSTAGGLPRSKMNDLSDSDSDLTRVVQFLVYILTNENRARRSQEPVFIPYRVKAQRSALIRLRASYVTTARDASL